MEEQWATIEEFPRYLVSTFGQVKRQHYERINANGQIAQMPEKSMKLRLAPNNKCPNYKAVTVDLRKENGHRKTVRVSRLVATAFTPNPNNFPIVNHLDSDPTNNYATNLEWTTTKGNSQHCVKSGRAYTGNQQGVNNGRCKHSEGQIKEIKLLLAMRKYSHQEIAIKVGATQNTVSAISCGIRWKHIEA